MGLKEVFACLGQDIFGRLLAITETLEKSESVAAERPQQSVPFVSDRAENINNAEKELNEEYNELRQSLRQEDKEVLKRSEQQWLKERGKFRDNPSEYLRITLESVHELNHMHTRSE